MIRTRPLLFVDKYYSSDEHPTDAVSQTVIRKVVNVVQGACDVDSYEVMSERGLMVTNDQINREIEVRFVSSADDEIVLVVSDRRKRRNATPYVSEVPRTDLALIQRSNNSNHI